MITNINLEPNNTRQTADNISLLKIKLLTDGLVITNDDWLKIQVNSRSNSFLSAALNFDHSQGNIDFQLLDFNKTSIRNSTSVTDNKFVKDAGLSNGTCYLRVYGYTYPIAGNGVEYNLQWDDFSTSNKTFDYEPNNTKQTTEDISSREGELLTGGIIISNGDWALHSCGMIGMGRRLMIHFVMP